MEDGIRLELLEVFLAVLGPPTSKAGGADKRGTTGAAGSAGPDGG